MARGGVMQLKVNYSEVLKNLEVAIARVERGTKKATIAACEEIKEMTLGEVPRMSSTLANSFFYRIDGRYRNFTAALGYGGNGDPKNPKTGQRASEYMVAVHEDVTAAHPIGKAKFLEDPLRKYQSQFVRNAARRIRGELG